MKFQTITSTSDTNMHPHIKRLADYGGFTERLTFDPENCSIWITAEIGFGESEGADQFHVQVVTFDYLQSCNSPMWGESVLMVKVFTWEKVESFIENLLARVSTDSW